MLNPSESYTGNKLLILDAGTGKTKKVTDLLNINTKDDQYVNFTDFGQFSDGSLYFQWDESSDSKRVFILSRDLKVTEVLDGGQAPGEPAPDSSDGSGSSSGDGSAGESRSGD